ncbi:hypothetical protein KIPB_012199, partial [Kipferlia bialata]
HMLGLAKSMQVSFNALAGMWARPGEADYGLSIGVKILGAHMSKFNPSPVMAAAGSVPRQMALLTESLEKHVETKGYASLNKTVVTRLYFQSYNNMLAKTAEPNALFDIENMQFLTLIANLTQQAAIGGLDTDTTAAIVYAMSHRFDKMAELTDPEEAQRIYDIAKAERSSPLAMFPVLSTAFKRIAVLEAMAPTYKGLTEGLVSSDPAFADAIMLATDMDAGLHLLAGFIGACPNREEIIAGRVIRSKLRLPECVGTVVDDRTLQLHFGALCCMNPAAALVSVGAWCRAMSTGLGIRMAGEIRAAHEREVEHTAVALKMPRAQVDIRGVVNAVIQSNETVSLAMISHPPNTDTAEHVVRCLMESGHQPVYGLHHNMAKNRIAICSMDDVAKIDLSDPIMHQSMKI